MLPAEVQKLVENEYARTSIRVKAKQLSRRKDFGSSCREDIEQDLWLHLLGQAARFDGDRSSLNTFIDRVVNSAAASLVRSREREMRADGFHAQSLDSIADDSSCKKRTLRSSLSPEDGARRKGRTPLSDIDQLEQLEALDSALASMPPEMRDMCEQLMAGTTPTTLARQFGISRRQMRRRLEEARAYFEAAGLGNS